MYNTFRHIDKTIIYFSRWSNKSYAIFNSIGKQVEIGFLSGIVQTLQTVKSCTSIQLIDYIFNGNEEEVSEGPTTEDASILDGVIAVWMGKLGLANNPGIGSDQAQFSIFIYKFITWASLRPLLFLAGRHFVFRPFY